jgi:hypothetical protein
MAGRRASVVAVLIAVGLLGGAATAQAAERECVGAIGPETVRGDVVVPEGAICEMAGTQVRGNVRVLSGAELYAEGANVRGNISAGPQAYVQPIDSTLRGNLTLSNSLGALVEGGSVSGNVQSTASEFLDLVFMRVDGDVQVEGGRTAVFAEGLDVRGSLHTSGAEFFDLYDSTVRGNFAVRNTFEGSIFCGNTLSGNPEFTSNSGLLTIGTPDEACGGNIVSGNVQVIGNTADTEISDNDIAGNLSCFENDPPPVGGGNRVEGDKEGQCEAL